ncbi:MAG: hypothetical protein KGO21_04645 [Hyphomicrobiales bacterium]|jgi:hypothetical protein|nr:hypothetical protein [Hyphomicrobiales bacterium]
MSKTPKDIALRMKKRKATSRKKPTKIFDWYEAAKEKHSVGSKNRVSEKEK